MKIGLFGGSFDPVHYGHLLLAQSALESAALDQILFMPAAKSPHKSNPPIATDRARLEMLQLAVADHPNFRISDLEIKRKGDSFTVDTLKELAKIQPDDQLFLIMGADSLADFPNWKEPDEILKLADLVVMDRPVEDGKSGIQDSDWDAVSPFTSSGKIEEYKKNVVAGRRFDFSSTEIRGRQAEGRAIRFLTSRAVEQYILAGKLYTG